MILTIAILSLIGFLLGIGFDLAHNDDNKPSPRLCMATIAVIGWWDISLVVAIILIVIFTIWFFIWGAWYKNN